jgi:hypothetical protein
VLFANFSSSDEIFSGKLTERTERIPHLLYYDTLHPEFLSSPVANVHFSYSSSFRFFNLNPGP